MRATMLTAVRGIELRHVADPVICLPRREPSGPRSPNPLLAFPSLSAAVRRHRFRVSRRSATGCRRFPWARCPRCHRDRTAGPSGGSGGSRRPPRSPAPAGRGRSGGSRWRCHRAAPAWPRRAALVGAVVEVALGPVDPVGREDLGPAVLDRRDVDGDDPDPLAHVLDVGADPHAGPQDLDGVAGVGPDGAACVTGMVPPAPAETDPRPPLVALDPLLQHHRGDLVWCTNRKWCGSTTFSTTI